MKFSFLNGHIISFWDNILQYLTLFFTLTDVEAFRYNCHPGNVQNCLRPMKFKFNFDLTREHYLRLGPLFDPDSIADFCLELESLEKCLAETTVCSRRATYFMLNAQTFVTGAKFLCNNVNITSCFSKDSVKYFFSLCIDDMLEELKKVLGMFNSYEMTNSIDNLRGIVEKHTICQTSFENCKSYIIEHECGSETLAWYDHYIQLIIDPMWLHFSAKGYIKLAYSYLVFSLACGCMLCIYLFFKYYQTDIESKLNYASWSPQQRIPVFKTLYQDTQKLLYSSYEQGRGRDTLASYNTSIYDYD